MITRKLQWSLALHLVFFTVTIQEENSRTYDTNEWIPITPSTEAKDLPIKRATGRVLNLDPPSQQKFFPDDDLHFKKHRPHPHHFGGQKNRFNGPKYENEYEFVRSVPQKVPHHQYFANQDLRVPVPNFDHPPPQQYNNRHVQHPRPVVPSTRERAPAPNAPSIYEEYNLAQNSTLPVYQTLGPASINQELIGAIQNTPIKLGAPQIVQQPQQTATLPQKNSPDNVQLVYVPLESLNSNQPISQSSQNIFRQVDPVNQQFSLEPNKQHRLENIQNDFITQALQAHKLQEQIQLGEPLEFQSTTTTTQKPSNKKKPNQPPLAVYLENQNEGNLDDVLEVLKDAKTIAVQDTVAPDSPQIFIGPSTLTVPEGYTRYPLPYLNTIDGNRLEKKFDHLPFFVAPLSFKAPPGYSKIPLPSPHVGSVIISTKDPNNDKRSAPKLNVITQTKQPQASYYSTARPNLQDNIIQSSIDSQDYFNQGHSFSSRPNYLELGVSNNMNKPSVSQNAYVPQNIYDDSFIRNYNPLSLKSQTFDLTNPQYQTAQENISPIPEEQPKLIETVQKAPSESSNRHYNQQSSAQSFNKPSRTNGYQQSQEFDRGSSRRPHEPTRQTFDTPSRGRQSNTQRSTTPKYSEESNTTPRRSAQRTRYTSTPNLISKENIELTTERAPSRSTASTLVGETPAVVTNFYAEEPQSPPKPIHQNISPLELAINEFELHQINTQLDSNPKNTYSSDDLLGELKPRIESTYQNQLHSNRSSEGNTNNRFTTNNNYNQNIENKPAIKRPLEYQYQNDKLNTGEEFRLPADPVVKQTYDYQLYTGKPEIISSFPGSAPENQQSYSIPTIPDQQPQLNIKETFHHHTRTQGQDSIPESDFLLSNKYKSPNDFNDQLEKQMKSEQKEPQSYTEQPVNKDSYPGFDPQLHRFANTPASILRDTGVESKPSTVPTPKSRRRGRPTRPTTTTTQEPSKETYTVLEEFSARQPSTTPQYPQTPKAQDNSLPVNVNPTSASTPTYSPFEENKTPQPVRTDVEVVPANVYNINQNSPAFTEQGFRSQNVQQQEYSNQRFVPQDFPQTRFGATPTEFQSQQDNNYFSPSQQPQYNEQRPVEPLVHNRGRKPEHVEPLRGFDNAGRTQNTEDIRQFSEEITNQNSNRGSPYELDVNQYNVGVSQLEQGLKEYQVDLNSNDRDEMSDIIKSLQDPSVRTLLIPKLLAPSNHQDRYKPSLENTTPYSTTTTTTTTTTARPTTEYTTTSTTRSRSRQRGGSRFSQSNTTTRRSVARRRPTHPSRTTTERSVSTTEYGDYQRNTKQRFRTRGRTTPIAISERISTTENEVYNGPSSEAVVDFRKTTPIQYETVVNHKQIKPEDEQYQKGLSSLQQEINQPISQYENTIPPNNGVHIQLANPEVERTIVNRPSAVQSKTTYDSSSGDHDETTKQTFRVRGRGRGRTRPTSTTERITTRRVITTTTTTPRPLASQNNEEEEFFGFIRQPNFKPPTSQIQVASATQQPQYYTNTNQNTNDENYQLSSGAKDFRVSYDNTNLETTTVRFVGEIKPRYPSTTTSSDNNSKPGRRSRIRTNPKKSYESSNSPKNHRTTYSDNQESVTRRANIVRNRGRSHYKPPPTHQRTKSEEEADIEGGNYPQNFIMQHKQGTTPAAPSFQITIDPHEEQDDEDDQAPHASLYKPTIIKPDEWHEATEDIDDSEAIAPDNNLQQADSTEPQPTSSTQEPFALAMKAEDPLGVGSQDTYQTTTESEVNDGKLSDDTINESTRRPAPYTENTSDENKGANEQILEKVTNNQKSEIKPKSKGRRRGVWKLVKQRPVDRLEGSESQNYFSVLNMFDEIKKENNGKGNQKDSIVMNYDQFVNLRPISEHKPYDYEVGNEKINTMKPEDITDEPENDYTNLDWKQEVTTTPPEADTTIVQEHSTEAAEAFTTSTTKKSDNIFDTLYSMFDFSTDGKATPQNIVDSSSGNGEKEDTTVSTTTLLNPTFPDEITDAPFTTVRNFPESTAETTTASEVQTTSTTVPPELPKRTFAVEPWEMKQVRTSTSTEVSHETEICYKGKCIKTKKGKHKRNDK